MLESIKTYIVLFASCERLGNSDQNNQLVIEAIKCRSKNKNIPCQFKFLLVGDPAVGKTSIITKYVDHTKEFFKNSVIPFDFRLKILDI